MAKEVKTIGVLTSGGDAPGMNAAIRAVTRRALEEGIEVVGILEGYTGLIEDKTVALTTESVSNIVTHGGTILYSSRCPEFKTEEGMAKAIKTCEKHQIDAIIAIGGDGTFRGATDLTNHGIPSIGLPGTIDNDITATELTIGYDTAVNTLLEMIDYLRDTCESHARCNVVEVMGNGCGMIALYAGIATGAVTIAIPEIKFDEDVAIAKIEATRAAGKRGIIAVFSEGLPSPNEQKYSEYFADRVAKETGIDTRFARCGHIIRGGSPTLRDRMTATQMGVEAVELLLAGKSNLVVCINENRINSCDIHFALILDRMYKNKLKPGDLDAFTTYQVAEMKARCEYRHKKIERLYQMAHEVCH